MVLLPPLTDRLTLLAVMLLLPREMLPAADKAKDPGIVREFDRLMFPCVVS